MKSRVRSKKVPSKKSKKHVEKKPEIDRKVVNYENVKKAFENKLITDLNNQTFFRNEDGSCKSLLYAALDSLFPDYDYKNFDWEAHELKRSQDMRDCDEVKLIEFLLDHGADPNIVEPDRDSFLENLIMEGRQICGINMMKKLINAGLDINKTILGTSRRGRYGLLRVFSGYAKDRTAEFLIESGINLEPACLDPEVCEGCNPLSRSIGWKNFTVSEILLSKGVNVNRFCKKGTSPLFCAVKGNNIRLVKRLLDLGASTHPMCKTWDLYFHKSALHLAVKEDYFKIMQLLLDHELIDVNLVHPDEGFSALHIAIEYNSLKCIDELLNANPDVNLVSKIEDNEKTAVELLNRHNKNLETVEKLRRHIVKLRAAGLHLNEKNLEAISGEEYNDFYAECCQQVELMKKTNISPTSHVNFFDLFFINDQKLALCLESTDNQEIFESEYNKTFSLYAGMIKYKLKKGFKWHRLREQVNDAVFILFNNYLPYPSMQKIFSYFTVNELMELQRCRQKEEEKTT